MYSIRGMKHDALRCLEIGDWARFQELLEELRSYGEHETVSRLLVFARFTPGYYSADLQPVA